MKFSWASDSHPSKNREGLGSLSRRDPIGENSKGWASRPLLVTGQAGAVGLVRKELWSALLNL